MYACDFTVSRMTTLVWNSDLVWEGFICEGRRHGWLYGPDGKWTFLFLWPSEEMETAHKTTFHPVSNEQPLCKVTKEIFRTNSTRSLPVQIRSHACYEYQPEMSSVTRRSKAVCMLLHPTLMHVCSSETWHCSTCTRFLLDSWNSFLVSQVSRWWCSSWHPTSDTSLGSVVHLLFLGEC